MEGIIFTWFPIFPAEWSREFIISEHWWRKQKQSQNVSVSESLCMLVRSDENSGGRGIRVPILCVCSQREALHLRNNSMGSVHAYLKNAQVRFNLWEVERSRSQNPLQEDEGEASLEIQWQCRVCRPHGESSYGLASVPSANWKWLLKKDQKKARKCLLISDDCHKQYCFGHPPAQLTSRLLVMRREPIIRWTVRMHQNEFVLLSDILTWFDFFSFTWVSSPPFPCAITFTCQ